MNTNIIVSASLFLSATAVAAPSQIDRVTVFADRAEVTRVRRVTCENGRANATFDHLPVEIDERTIRGDVVGGGKVVGTTSRVVHEDVAPEEEIAKLEEQIRQIEAKIRAQTDTRRSLRQERAGVDRYAVVLNGVVTEAMRNPRPKRQVWMDALDGFKKKRQAIAEKEVVINGELRKLRVELLKLQRLRGALGNQRSDARRIAGVAVDCTGKVLKVELSYVVPGARWRPEYDLDFRPDRGRVGKGKARLTVSAVIQQSKGEDWSKVQVSLSTAKPRLGSEAPMPRPLYVNGYEVKDGKVLVEAQERREKLKASGKAQKDTGAQGASLENKGRSFILRIPHRVSVAADGRPYWVPVDVKTARGESVLAAVPKLTSYVYQLVRLDNPAPYPLLAGTIHSYRDGKFVGDTNLRYRGVGEPMEISLGIDESFKVRREEVLDKRKKAGLFSSKKKIVQELEITLVNNDTQPATIELKEAVPVSKVDDVRVEITSKTTTGGYAFDRERGFVVWPVRLGKGKKQKVHLGYTIKVPDDWKVRIR